MIGIALVALTSCAPVPAERPTETSLLVSSASPSPSATASVLDDHFGLIVGDREAKVRSETTDTVIASFTPQARSWTSLSRTISPDGRLIAYWAPVDNGPVLHVRSANSSSDRAVFTGRSDMSGNAFAWSSDGGGLVVAIDNDCQEFCAVQGGRSVAELWTVDLASGAAEKIASGRFWLPAAWDRAARLVAAGVTGPGGYLVGYDVIDLHQQPYAVRSTGFRPTVQGRLKASSDARYVLLSVDSGVSTTVAWWPLAAPDRRQDIVVDGVSAEWRPGTSEIWWASGRTPTGCRTAPCSGSELVAFDVATNARTTVFRGAFGWDLAGFRADGSAVMTLLYGATQSLVVVDAHSGRTANLPVGGPFVRLR